MSQAQLARTIGVSERNVVRWENDQHTPRVEHLAAIAEATGVDVESLLENGDDDDEDGDAVRLHFEGFLSALRAEVRKAAVNS